MQRNLCWAPLLTIALVCPKSAVARQLSNEDVRDMWHTVGFVMGQNFSLDEAARKFPSLAVAIEIAKLEFNDNFGPAVAAMSTKLEEADAARWQQMLKVIGEKFDYGALTEAQASEFVAVVRQRAKGQMEERALQTLLMWDPVHQARPGSEFAKYRQKFVANGDGKSKGIKLQMEYPASWASLEAERPNIVRKFISERGRGTESAMILVSSLPFRQPTRGEMEGLSEADIRQFVPPGGQFISGKRISFDGLPGVMVTFRLAADRFGQDFRLRLLVYTTFYRDRTISVQFSTDDATDDADSTFTRFEPLFRLMANSVVILSRYDGKGTPQD